MLIKREERTQTKKGFRQKKSRKRETEKRQKWTKQ